MPAFDPAEVVKLTLWVLSLILLVVLLGLYGLRKIREGLREAGRAEGPLESGQVPGANKEMTFVFQTFHQTLEEINRRKQELIRMHQDAVERIRQMERYNECILESMVSGVAAFDREGRLTSLNRAAAAILGLAREPEMVGRPYAELLRGSTRLAEILERVLRENTGVLREEIEYTTPDGEHRWLGVNASPLQGESGEPMGATLLFTDLTEVKELERQVELKNRLAAMGEMSAGIAHEFRNSLGAILGYARLVERRAGEDGTLRDAAEGILSEVKAFDAMLAEFLGFARPAELHPDACRLDEVVREVLALLEPEIRGKGISVSVEGTDLPELRLDRTLMRQALTNLVKNAVEAVEAGGSVRIVERRLGDRVELRIEDDGCGIPEQDQAKIFEPFFTRKREGTGLGLAITQKTVLAHRGSVRVESGAGRGTAMIVTLPLDQAAA